MWRDMLEIRREMAGNGEIWGRGEVERRLVVRGALVDETGRLERHELARGGEGEPQLGLRDAERRGELLVGRLAAGGEEEVCARLADRVDAIVHVYRQPDGAGVVSECARDGLLDPVVRVGGEAALVVRVKLVDGGDQPEGALLDEVLDVDAAVGVLFGNRDDEPEVGCNHAVLGHLHYSELVVEALVGGRVARVKAAHRRRPLRPVRRPAERLDKLVPHAQPPQQLLDGAGEADLLLIVEEAARPDRRQVPPHRLVAHRRVALPPKAAAPVDVGRRRARRGDHQQRRRQAAAGTGGGGRRWRRRGEQ
mmetsp:Transcript_26293/g.78552  ORF Transcript_26293/g.78552 Transcript_26293/m.78552 type:complete len:308 (+) Transcript_26293:1-924(+)